MSRGQLISLFWNEKFLKSLNSYHFGIINESDILKHETFSSLVTWLDKYLDRGYYDEDAAKEALYAKMNEVGIILDGNELENIMK